MLNEHDAQWISGNREEITQGRTEPITVMQRIAGAEDPFTGDTTYTEQAVQVNVTWSAATGQDDVKYVNGIEVLSGDFIASTVNLDVDLSEVSTITKDGVEYKLVAYDVKGLAGDNRYEALARRVV